jgi:hypothetical protein
MIEEVAVITDEESRPDEFFFPFSHAICAVDNEHMHEPI